MGTSYNLSYATQLKHLYLTTSPIFRYDDVSEPISEAIKANVFGAIVLTVGGKNNNEPRIELANGTLLSPEEVQVELARYLISMYVFQTKEVPELITCTVPVVLLTCVNNSSSIFESTWTIYIIYVLCTYRAP